MKLTREDLGCELSHGAWFVHGVNEWMQFRHPTTWNWVDFRFVHLAVEWDRAVPGWEVEVLLLGLGLRWRYNGDWNTTELGRDLLAFQRSAPCPTCGNVTVTLKAPDGPH